MADCPCGCGREISWANRGVVATANEILALLPIVERFALLCERNPEEDAESARLFFNQGCTGAEALMRFAHGDRSQGAKADMPSFRRTGLWFQRASEIEASVQMMDPAWVKWWDDLANPGAQVRRDPVSRSCSIVLEGDPHGEPALPDEG